MAAFIVTICDELTDHDVREGFVVYVVPTHLEWGTSYHFRTREEVDFLVSALRKGGHVIETLNDDTSPRTANEEAAFAKGYSLAWGIPELTYQQLMGILSVYQKYP